jgi:serine phosphatase RsbU (regulator of sigma subunit)
MILQSTTLTAQTPADPGTLSWFLGVLLVCTVTGGILYFRWLNRRFKDENKKLSDKLSERSYQVMVQKWELERKNHAISEKNQENLDSLLYARNIQTSVLPRPEKMKSAFRDSFVLYKPKDIVSGDFYFLEKSGDRIIVAAADCTGHGVAGAFMSMVGSSLLNQIINQEKIIEPAKILHHLNEGIVDALRQKETSSHSGMDIAVCSIDLQKKELMYAGANRPLWIMRGEELEIVKADKIAIGGFLEDEERAFTNQQVSFSEGDCIYLFTDGYADQFGGMEGKKIMTKKFKDLIVSMHHTDMTRQCETLDGFFENWKGKFEQVDDVLVIGIRA